MTSPTFPCDKHSGRGTQQPWRFRFEMSFKGHQEGVSRERNKKTGDCSQFERRLVPFRVDLPVKKLDELAKARNRSARLLKKVDDGKRGDLIALWKLCNIYSATAVDLDDAMREIRGSLRKRIKPVAKDASPFRKFVDEYRPANKQPQDIYDSNRPTVKEKRFLDLFKKKDTRKISAAQDAEQSYTQHLVDAVKANYRSAEVLPPKPAAITSVAAVPVPPEPASSAPPIPPTERLTAQQAVQAVEGGRGMDAYAPIVKTRTATSKDKLENVKRMSMPVVATTESDRRAQLPPVAPPRREKMENTSIKRSSPALPPRPKEDGWKKPDLTTVPPTVIQLDGRVPLQQPTGPPPVSRRPENATTIQVGDAQSSPPSPSTTIRIGGDVPVAMSPKVSNERVQRQQSESIPPRPVQQAQYVTATGEKQTVNRF